MLTKKHPYTIYVSDVIISKIKVGKICLDNNEKTFKLQSMVYYFITYDSCKKFNNFLSYSYYIIKRQTYNKLCWKIEMKILSYTCN